MIRAALIIVLRLPIVFTIAALKLILVFTYLRIDINSLSIGDRSGSLLIYNYSGTCSLVRSSTFTVDVLTSVRLVLFSITLVHSYDSLAYFLGIDVVYILIWIFVHAHFWIR